MIPYYSQRQGYNLEKRVEELETGGVSGKRWHKIQLSQSDFQEIETNGECSYRLAELYDPTYFNNDYLELCISIDSEVQGTELIHTAPLSKAYVNFKYKDTWCNEWMKILFCDITSGRLIANYPIGFVYAEQTGDSKSYVIVNTKLLNPSEFKDDTLRILIGIETANQIGGSWKTSDECPLYDRKAADVMENGEAWVGPSKDKDFILVYKLNDTYYYASPKDDGEAKLSGIDLHIEGKGNIFTDIQWAAEEHRSVNPLNDNNVIYIVDATAQSWEWDVKNSDSEAAVTAEKGEPIPLQPLEPQAYGKQFVIVFNGKTDIHKSYLLVFEDNKLPIINSQHNIIEWRDTYSGKVYHVTWDNDALKYSLGAELTEDELNELYENGLEFNSAKGADAVVSDDGRYGDWTALIEGDRYRIGSSLLSTTPFTEPTQSTSMSMVCRPQYVFVDRVSYNDPDTGEHKVSVEGGYIWEGEIEGTPLSIAIPADDPTVGIIQISEEKSSDPSRSSKVLYRHTLTIDSNWDASEYQDSNRAHISFLAINTQIGEPTPEYLLFSDMNTGWSIPASGVVIVDNVAYNVYRVETKTIDGGDWALVASYYNNAGTPAEAVILRPSNLHLYMVTDFLAEIR